jgi:hypothetical protein
VAKRYKDRTGKLRAYFRRPGFEKVVLPGAPGSKEFMAAYCAAMAMVPVAPIAPKPAAVKAARIAVGTVSAAIEAYQRSTDFARLAAATAGPRRRVLHQFAERSHGLALAKVTTAAIKEVIEARPAGTGKKWLNGIRAMFDYAIASGQLTGPNPCDGLSIRIAVGIIPGPKRRSRNMKRGIRSAPRRGGCSRWRCSRVSGAAIWC